MAKIGEEGVLLLLSESTNAERPGFTPSEQMVEGHLDIAFLKAEQKIIVSTFASNISRIQQIVNATWKTNRKLVLLGRTMLNVVEIAIERGYLDVPADLIIDRDDIHHFEPHEIVILCTGSQGEPLAALSRLSTGEFRGIDVLPGDTVIFAAGPIPGNEKNITAIVDNFFALGANVIYGTGSTSGMHVSGHGYQEDLKLMLALMKPKFFIPIHGEYRMLHHHCLLAESIGVEKENTFILKNGEVVEIEDGTARMSRKIPIGNIYVDDGEVGEMEFVLRDRRQISKDGMLIIVLTMSKYDGRLLAEPETISRGFSDQNFSKLRKGINEITLRKVIELYEEDNYSWNGMKKQIKKSIREYVRQQTKKRPMIVPIFIEI